MPFTIDGISRPASEVAQQVHYFCVVRATQSLFDPNTLQIPNDKRDAFYSRILLYCEASALRIILAKRMCNPRYDELLREFEGIIFTQEPTEGGDLKVRAIRSAVNELDALFMRKNELAWCRRWFQAIGINQTNPNVSMLFARLLAINSTHTRKALIQVGPPTDQGGQPGTA
jgi:hypothetical protein